MRKSHGETRRHGEKITWSDTSSFGGTSQEITAPFTKCTTLVKMYIILIIGLFLFIFYFVRRKKIKRRPTTIHYSVFEKEDFPRQLCLIGDVPSFAKKSAEGAAKTINRSVGYPLFVETVDTVDSLVPANLNIKFEKRDDQHVVARHKMFDGPGQVLAHATLNGNIICVDDDEPWTRSFLKTVLIHEIFHSLGMHHSNFNDSIMYFRYNANVNKPTARDVATLRKMFKFLPVNHLLPDIVED